MRVETTSGLNGELIEYRRTWINHSGANPQTEAVVIVLRDGYSVEAARPYSTHIIETMPDGTLSARNGNYDLTLGEAEKDLEARAPRPKL